MPQWDTRRVYCKATCYVRGRFGDPKDRRSNGLVDLEKVLAEPKLRAWIERKAARISEKFGIDREDILQDFYLSRMLGHFSTIEQSGINTVKTEYSRGFTKQDRIPKDVFSGELLEHVREKRNDADRIEFMYDLRLCCNDLEYQMACFYMAGFGQYEIYEETRGCGKKAFFEAWRRLGLQRASRHEMDGTDIQWSNGRDAFAAFPGDQGDA